MMEELVIFFNKIKGKKCIIIGLNEMTEPLWDMFPWDINCIIDVSNQFIGKNFKNKPVFSPEFLSKEDPEKIAIIISGQYHVFLDEWLSNLGLKANQNYWFGATLLEWYEKNKQVMMRKSVNIIRMSGGLGDQIMFFAIGCLLEEKLNVTIKYDLSWFTSQGNFSLTDIFNVKIDIATEDEISRYKAFHYYNHCRHFRYTDEFLSEKCDRYIDGVFLNYRYFSEIQEKVKKELIIKLPFNDFKLEIVETINNCSMPSIAMHVPSKSYIGTEQEVVTSDYYKQAIRTIVDKIKPISGVHLFIFSDHIQWVKKELQIEYPATYIESNGKKQDDVDLYLMSKCNHFIISNTTFSMWAALLSSHRDKVVIAPERWFTHTSQTPPVVLASRDGHDSGASWPREWVTLPNVIEKKFDFTGQSNINNSSYRFNQCECSFGELNQDKTFYVIRRNLPGAGFFSNFFHVLSHIMIAEENGYYPIVDMCNYETFYSEQGEINGTKNVWEYYFKPLIEFSLDEVYNSKKVILSSGETPALNLTDLVTLHSLHAMIKKYIEVRWNIDHDCKKMWIRKIGTYQKTVGIHVRGTDMKVQALHAIPPTVLEILEKTKQLINEDKDIDSIFLCSDEEETIAVFKKQFGEMVTYNDFYRGKNQDSQGIHVQAFVQKHPRKEHKYKLGLEVLIDMMMLSKCHVLLCGISNISAAAIAFNHDQYNKVIIIDKGHRS